MILKLPILVVPAIPEDDSFQKFTEPIPRCLEEFLDWSVGNSVDFIGGVCKILKSNQANLETIVDWKNPRRQSE